MKPASLWLYGALAALGLAAAFATWQRPRQDVSTGAVKVLEATRATLESVRVEESPRFVQLTRQGERVLVTQGWLPGEAEKWDAGAPVDGGLAAERPPPTRTMTAGERGEQLWARFQPLEAARALGKLPDAKLAELGLLGSGRFLDVTVSGTTHRLVLARAVPGQFGNYLRDERTKEVYLLQASLMGELDPAASVLIDRRLHRFKQADFDRVVVKVGDKQVELLQSGLDSPGGPRLARATAPDTTDELARNWHDKLFSRLVVTKVLGQGEEPADEAKVKVRVEYFNKQELRGFVELALDRYKAAWARSENLQSWVGLSEAGEEVIYEAERLVQAP